MVICIEMCIRDRAGIVSQGEKVKITSIFPWFILCFLGMAAINSLGVFPQELSSGLKELSKFLMVAALAAIGLNTDFREMRKSGINPMIHGFIISALVVVVAIAVEYFMEMCIRDSRDSVSGRKSEDYLYLSLVHPVLFGNGSH